MKRICLILSSLLLFASHVYSANVTGVAFLDSNRNGKLDHGEKRLRGVLISNGDTIVVTDKHGCY